MHNWSVIVISEEQGDDKLVFVSRCSSVFAFRNQRFTLRRHWQLSAYCLTGTISQILYRAVVMNPKLGMNTVEQHLFNNSFSLALSVIAPFLITLQASRPAMPIAHLSRLPAHMAPTFSYSVFDVFSRNRCTLRYRRAVWQSHPLLFPCLLYD